MKKTCVRGYPLFLILANAILLIVGVGDVVAAVHSGHQGTTSASVGVSTTNGQPNGAPPFVPNDSFFYVPGPGGTSGAMLTFVEVCCTKCNTPWCPPPSKCGVQAIITVHSTTTNGSGQQTAPATQQWQINPTPSEMCNDGACDSLKPMGSGVVPAVATPVPLGHTAGSMQVVITAQCVCCTLNGTVASVAFDDVDNFTPIDLDQIH